LASLGIIYLMPLFKILFKKINFLRNFFLYEVLAITLSAQIFTLPILIYNFGQFSLLAPITNVLLVPLLPFLMGIGFFFLLFGILWQPLGWILSLPLSLFLGYLIAVVNIFSQLPLSALTLKISWIWLPAYYSCFLLFFYVLRKRKLLLKEKEGDFLMLKRNL